MNSETSQIWTPPRIIQKGKSEAFLKRTTRKYIPSTLNNRSIARALKGSPRELVANKRSHLGIGPKHGEGKSTTSTHLLLPVCLPMAAPKHCRSNTVGVSAARSPQHAAMLVGGASRQLEQTRTPHFSAALEPKDKEKETCIRSPHLLSAGRSAGDAEQSAIDGLRRGDDPCFAASILRATIAS